jgi:hypothetical protein
VVDTSDIVANASSGFISHPLVVKLGMTRNRLKRPRDPVQLAKLIGDIATGTIEEKPALIDPPKGRAGGLVGGKARAIVLTPTQRKKIAQKAAKTRWKAAVDDD